MIYDFCGFEENDLAALHDYSNLSLVSGGAASGGFHGRINLGAGDEGWCRLQHQNMLGQHQLGFAVNLAALPVAASRALACATVGIDTLSLTVDPNGKLQVWWRGFAVSSANGALAAAGWHRVEWWLDLAATFFQTSVSVDGVQRLSGTLSPVPITGLHAIYFGSLGVFNTVALDAAYDDLVYDAGDNILVLGGTGVGVTLARKPTAIGSGNGWSGAAANVDEWPGASDADSTFASGLLDGRYTPQSASGLVPSGSILIAVRAAALMRTEGVAADLRTGLAKAGTLVRSTRTRGGSTSYVPHAHVAVTAFGDSGVDWTPALMDTYDVVLESVEDGVTARCTALATTGLYAPPTATNGGDTPPDHDPIPPSGLTVPEGRTLWRELANEKNTSIVPDATVDRYLQIALEAMNRRTGFTVKEDSTTVTFLVNSSEYPLPTDFCRMAWVYWNGRFLKKSSIEEWQRGPDPVNWRDERSGEPEEYALLGMLLVVRPRPSAAAVAAALHPTLKYVAGPGVYAAAGFGALADGNQRAVVQYAAAVWRAAHPDTDMAPASAELLLQLFEQDAQLVGAEYLARGMER